MRRDEDQRGAEAGEDDQGGRPRANRRRDSRDRNGGQGQQSVAEAISTEEETPGTHRQRRAVGRIEPLFDGATLALYAAVGVLLIAVAVVALGYAVVSVPENLGHGVPEAISTFLSELLLVLILVEIMRTILTFITTRTTSIRPFLTVTIISSVRRILSIGAKLTLVEDLPREEFNRAMIELAAEGGLVLIVAVALFLLSRREGG